MARSTRAAASAAAAPPRVTLLSLPDEILAQVFTALHTRYQHRRIGTPPTHFLQICKRLYAIARPIWLSVLVVPEPKTDEYCAKMLEHPTALAHVKDLQLQLEADPPAWKLALFLHLSKLQTLRLRETSGKNQVRVTYSNEAMLAVESLTTLSHLHILSPKTGLIRMSPRPLIRKMDLPISSHVLLNFRSLEQLTLRIDVDSDPTECEYNWDTLNALEFIVDPQLSSTPELFLRKVANQSLNGSKAMSLQELDFTISTGVSTNYDDFLDTLICAFQNCEVTALIIDCPEHDLNMFSVRGGWPALTHLSLSVSQEDLVPHRLENLEYVLQRCGKLISLTIAGMDFTACACDCCEMFDPDDFIECDEEEWTCKGRNLIATVHLVRHQTQIRDLRIQGSDRRRELRWTRANTADDFALERWTLF
ncbi:hypothetical protein JCM8115_001169 [Rhodotorula mucilaginosa]